MGAKEEQPGSNQGWEKGEHIMACNTTTQGRGRGAKGSGWEGARGRVSSARPPDPRGDHSLVDVVLGQQPLAKGVYAECVAGFRPDLGKGHGRLALHKAGGIGPGEPGPDGRRPGGHDGPLDGSGP